MTTPVNSGADLIWGVEDIARAAGRTKRQTYYLLEKGILPAAKVGGRWVSSHTKMAQHFDRLIEEAQK